MELPKLEGLDKGDLKNEAVLVRWAKFFTARTDEELAEAAREDEMVGTAKDILEHLSADPKVQQMVRMREEGEFLYRVDLAEAEARGKAEGEARGEAKGKAEGEVRGEARGKRDVLLMLLDRSGVSLTAEQRRQIESCDDISRLDEWIGLALSGEAGNIFNSDGDQ